MRIDNNKQVPRIYMEAPLSGTPETVLFQDLFIYSTGTFQVRRCYHLFSLNTIEAPRQRLC